MTAVKITVLKRALHQDLVDELSNSDIAPCGLFREGQEFIAGFDKPDGFCSWAWGDISKMVVALHAGARFDKGPFNDWMKDGTTGVACCTDGFRPVTFKLERIDTRELIDASSAERPAPRDAYASERWGEFSYVFPSLKSDGAYRLRLHFCEIYHQAAGKRRFGVELGGKRVLDEFDIVAEAGGPNKAVVREFDARADKDGAVRLRFVKGSADFPKVSAIEIAEAGDPRTAIRAVNAGGGAVGPFAADACFEGGSAAGG